MNTSGKGKTLCAICDRTNATTRLCAKCKVDPANDSWGDSDGAISVDLDTELARIGGDVARHADMIQRRARTPTDLQRRIMRDACVVVAFVYYDKYGHAHRRYRALRTPEIAKRQRCAQSHAWRTIARYTGQAS